MSKSLPAPAAPDAPEPPSPIVTIAGKAVDLRAAFPLLLRDWREIKKRTGKDVTQTNLPDFGIDALVPFLAYVAAKSNPEVTFDDIDGLTVEQMLAVFNTIRALGLDGGGKTDERPT